MSATTKYHRFPFLDQLSVLKADNYATSFPAHRHEEYSITLVRRGFETTKIHGKELETLTGTISFTPPKEIHANPNGNKGTYDFTTFYPCPELLHQLLPKKALVATGCTIRDEQVFQGLLDWQKSPSDPTVFTDLIRRLLHQLPIPAESGGEMTGKEMQQMAGVVAYIESHLEDPIKLSDLARVAGLSEAHFLRLFKKQRGITPLQFVTLRRIEMAKMLLHRGSPPAATALQVGFYDQSHFHRFFLRHTGLTPGQFQRNSNIVQSLPGGGE